MDTRAAEVAAQPSGEENLGTAGNHTAQMATPHFYPAYDAAREQREISRRIFRPIVTEPREDRMQMASRLLDQQCAAAVGARASPPRRPS